MIGVRARFLEYSQITGQEQGDGCAEHDETGIFIFKRCTVFSLNQLDPDPIQSIESQLPSPGSDQAHSQPNACAVSAEYAAVPPNRGPSGVRSQAK